MNDYAVSVATIIAIQAIGALGLNVIVGYAGQISLGHAAFFGIGAYACAMLTTNGLSFWLALPVVLAISGSVGALLGLPSIRLKEDFLAITTIGINFIVEAIFLYTPFFGGALGIGGIPRVVFLGEKLKGVGFLWLCLAFLGASVLGCLWFRRSWLGLGCFAIREDETAAASMGIWPMKFKLSAFVVGAKLAALSGALYAHYMRFISPGDFGFPVSVMFLSMVVLGGMGTLWGPVVGAVVLGILPEVFRPIMEYRMLLYGALLLGMIRFQPGGLLGDQSLAMRVFRRLRLRGGD
ncbi:branched-chain amino acid ABC transporter permease [Thermanaerovibrio acidaminovorans]|uniref:branched-chain amino acid ABC transporter permease n=1 Tax=Thermanaerovibrio acidaminovorans TaxID=81462 RepID=UPI0024905503|nr:branched-chain amino acid ABC transporter permease [Thermanaerovibrio acidaminovorans]